MNLAWDFLLYLHLVRNIDAGFSFQLFKLFVILHCLLCFLQDNICDNVLNLNNGQLIVEDEFPYGTHCQWVISAQDDVSYVILEFQDVNVKKILCSFKIIMCILNN